MAFGIFGVLPVVESKGTGKVFFCKHLFGLSFAESSERNRKLRNSDEFPWEEYDYSVIDPVKRDITLYDILRWNDRREV